MGVATCGGIGLKSKRDVKDTPGHRMKTSKTFRLPRPGRPPRGRTPTGEASFQTDVIPSEALGALCATGRQVMPMARVLGVRSGAEDTRAQPD